jgi:leader peptidase (prepilin peptidase)/N-methyltransferase
LFSRFGVSFVFFVTLFFVAALVVISFIDLDVRIVPDVISLPGIILDSRCQLSVLLSEADQALCHPHQFRFSVFSWAVGFLLATAWIMRKLTGVEGWAR